MNIIFCTLFTVTLSTYTQRKHDSTDSALIYTDTRTGSVKKYWIFGGLCASRMAHVSFRLNTRAHTHNSLYLYIDVHIACVCLNACTNLYTHAHAHCDGR